MWKNHAKPEKKAFAHHMRENPTPSEMLLWERLRLRRFHRYRFRRQKVLLGWIVDFFCPQIRLAVEVDGDSHRERAEKDARRDEALRKRHVLTVRVTAERVCSDLDGVMREIRAGIDAQIAAGVGPSRVPMPDERDLVSEKVWRFLKRKREAKTAREAREKSPGTEAPGPHGPGPRRNQRRGRT